MAITLPALPGARSATPRLQDWGADLTPSLGGAMQRLNRLGSRHALDVEMPPMLAEPDGRIWVSRLKRGKTDRVLFEFPQLDLVIGSPGSPKVKTVTAGGTSVPLKGLTPGYAIREGQFFSIIHNGRRYLHSADAQAIADAVGDVTVTVTPMLRVSLSVDDVVEIAKPMIEGALAGDEFAWSIDVARTVGLAFSIVEAE